MSVSHKHVYTLKRLLNVPESQILDHRVQAEIEVNVCLSYVLSPVFILMGGWELRKAVIKKFHILPKRRIFGLLFSIPTLLLCDELIICMTYLLASTFMCTLWLPDVQTASYKKGYDAVMTDMRWSCYPNGPYQLCRTCDQEITYDLTREPAEMRVTPNGGCSSLSPIRCDSLNNTGIMEASRHLYSDKAGFFVDPFSRVDATYVAYTMTGSPTFGSYVAMMCDQTVQGDMYRKDAAEMWVVYYMLILVAMTVLYVAIYEGMERIHRCTCAPDYITLA